MLMAVIYFGHQKGERRDNIISLKKEPKKLEFNLKQQQSVYIIFSKNKIHSYQVIAVQAQRVKFRTQGLFQRLWLMFCHQWRYTFDKIFPPSEISVLCITLTLQLAQCCTWPCFAYCDLFSIDFCILASLNTLWFALVGCKTYKLVTLLSTWQLFLWSFYSKIIQEYSSHFPYLCSTHKWGKG